MKILLRFYLISTHIIYLLSMYVWLKVVFFAYFFISNTSNFEFVIGLIALPVFAYPFVTIFCSIYGWKNYMVKPISILFVNFIPMFWVIGYWIFWLLWSIR